MDTLALRTRRNHLLPWRKPCIFSLCPYQFVSLFLHSNWAISTFVEAPITTKYQSTAKRSIVGKHQKEHQQEFILRWCLFNSNTLKEQFPVKHYYSVRHQVRASKNQQKWRRQTTSKETNRTNKIKRVVPRMQQLNVSVVFILFVSTSAIWSGACLSSEPATLLHPWSDWAHGSKFSKTDFFFAGQCTVEVVLFIMLAREATSQYCCCSPSLYRKRHPRSLEWRRKLVLSTLHL